MKRFGAIAFTPSVKSVQAKMGSRDAYARTEAKGDAVEGLGPEEIAFLAERDSFYMASVGETGWPYVQHRGGAKGFVQVLDDRTLAFADFAGNRQYVSVGNVGGDDRVALVFVDYPNRARLKILARVKLVDRAADAAFVDRLVAGSEHARVERAFVLHVEAFDWNCPRHITPRFTREEIDRETASLRATIAHLEAENHALRARLAKMESSTEAHSQTTGTP